MPKKDIHVVPRNGGWARVKEGSSKAVSVHRTQREAIARARDVAKRERVSVIVHGKDGRIRDSDSYGNDPSPRRDVKSAPRRGKIPVKRIKEAARRAKR